MSADPTRGRDDARTYANGPLFVRGHVRIVDEQGIVQREATRLALCRCGGSGNKPFCDGSHRTNGFTTERTP